jgi:hypothetical protein
MRDIYNGYCVQQRNVKLLPLLLDFIKIISNVKTKLENRFCRWTEGDVTCRASCERSV